MENHHHHHHHHHQMKLSVTPSMAVGLRILLIQKATTIRHNSVVASSTIHSSPKLLSLSPEPVNFTCFLRSCHLCRKELRPDKDIYMYRGDLGFCSIQCRERQMVVDDMNKLEKSTKKMVANSASWHCRRSSNRRPTTEISLLRDELRRRLNQLPAQNIRPVFS